MSPWFRAAALVMLLLPSCAKIPGLGGDKAKAEDKSDALSRKEALMAASSALRAGGGSGGGTAVAAGSNVPISPTMITPDNEISWTDPDHPENGIPELSTLMAAPKKGLWEDNESIARQRAVRDGKPLLIYFTDSQRSPTSRQLDDELFAKKDFEQWAKEKFVRLRIDAYPRVKDPNLSMEQATEKEIENKAYIAEMNKRYKVMGYPALLVLSPSGDVIGRYKGYKAGGADYTWGLLKQGQGLAAKAGNEWRSGLMQKGYREWQDRSGNKVFAKLLSYSNGTLYLVEPDGRRSRTVENRLSDPDRDWIKQQKLLRGIQ